MKSQSTKDMFIEMEKEYLVGHGGQSPCNLRAASGLSQ